MEEEEKKNKDVKGSGKGGRKEGTVKGGMKEGEGENKICWNEIENFEISGKKVRLRAFEENGKSRQNTNYSIQVSEQETG